MDTTLRKFVVSNGRNKPRVLARSPFLAAVEAVKTGSLKSLGLLLEVIDLKKQSDPFYVSTEKVLREAGMRSGADILAAHRRAMYGRGTQSGSG